MILNSQEMFSEAQAVATGASTNTIDLGAIGTPVYGSVALPRDLGAGTKIPLLVQIVEDVAGATAVSVALQTASDDAFTSPTTLATMAFPALTAGSRCSVPVIPYGACDRYLRLYYTVTGTATAGKITAGISAGNDETIPYI